MYQRLGLVLSSATTLMPRSRFIPSFSCQITAGNKKAARRPPCRMCRQNGKNQGMAMTLTTITSAVKGTPMRTKSTNL